jgi:HlyD family type I secretion membrane fusion protein
MTGPIALRLSDDGPQKPEEPGFGRAIRGPLLFGLALVVLFFAGFGTWSAIAPLASAAVAPGLISPDGSRRTIQHLEGGIIREILVRDGSRVEAGEPLLVLEDIAARAGRDARMANHYTLLATEARLAAEAEGAAEPVFPAEVRRAAARSPEVARILEDQASRFAARRATIDGRKAVLRRRAAQLEAEIGGLEDQIASQERQIALIEQETANVRLMVDRGLERLPRLLSLQRQQAEIDGERAANVAAIARARQAIAETEMQVLNLDAEMRDRVAEEISRVRTEIRTLQEELRHSEDVLERTVITAPVAGTVVELRFHTIGGVIRPGDPILDIVPEEEDLLIDARISPTDIDAVRPGQTARIHFSAYAQRNQPRIEGTVRQVSADSLVDEQSGQRYYLARVRVDRDQLAELAPEIEIIPGMPAEALIVTGRRTVLDYLLDPVDETLRRGLRED